MMLSSEKSTSEGTEHWQPCGGLKRTD